MKTVTLAFLISILNILTPEHNPVTAQVGEYGYYSITWENKNGDPAKEYVLIEQTDTIIAKLGNIFGVTFAFTSERNEPVHLTAVYRFPELHDPKGDTRYSTCDIDAGFFPEDPTYTMTWLFERPFECIPGEWVFEIWDGSEKLAEKKFTVIAQEEE